MKGTAVAEELFTPEADVTERGADGLDRLVAPKGIPISMERAKELGLVKEPKPPRPRETKKADEAEKKADEDTK